MTKTLLWLSCAASALAFGASGAQAATDTAAAAASSDANGSVAELVVVAEHHETSLQKIPVAVSVFTGRERDTIGINSVQDVTNFAPGFSYDPATTHPYIRGVGRQSVNVTDDERVATYEDEFFVYTAYQLDQSSLFLQQEQIERGPQNVGGRNAAAGSIDMVSVRPTDHPYAELRASVGNYDTYNIEGAASDQIAPGVTARIAGYYHDQGEGYFTNLANGQTQGGLIHEWYLQGQVDWKINDKADLWVKGFWSGWHNNQGDAGARTDSVGGSWDETNLSDSNGSLTGSLFVNPNYGYAALLPAAAAGHNPGDPLPISATLANPNIFNNPSAANPRDFVNTDPLDRTVNLNNYRGVSGIFTYDFGGFQMKYVGGIQGYDYTLDYGDQGPGGVGGSNVQSFTLPGSTVGCSALAAYGLGGVNCPTAFALAHLGTLPAASTLVINPTVNFEYQEDNSWWSHELVFQSTNDSPLQWEAGGFYYKQHYSNPFFITDAAQPNLAQPYNLGAFLGSVTPAALAANPLGFLTSGLTTAGVAPNPNNYVAYQNYVFDVQSVAGYGQVSYKFNDQWKVTGNLRYTSDSKSGLESARFIQFNSTFIDLYSPFLGANSPSFDATVAGTCPTGNPASCYSGSVLGRGVASAGVVGANGVETRELTGASQAFTGGAGVEYTPTNDIFVYARYGRGYEDMSFNAGFISANPEVAPEFLNSYEVGYKQNFGRTLRIDVAGFYYDYENLQLPITVTAGGLLQNEFINAPKAESAGVEIEGNWAPVRNLSFTLSYSYDYTAILTGCSGTVTAGVLAPAPGALCVIDTNDPAAVAPGANPIPHQVYNATTNPGVFQSVKGDPLPNAPLNKLAINVAYTWNFDPGDFTLSGSFEYRDSQVGGVFNRFYDTAPSWTGVDLRGLWKSKGDKYEVIGYVKNVFNSLQYQVGTDGAGLFGNASQSLSPASGLNWVNVYNLAPPRTYGMEVRYKFF